MDKQNLFEDPDLKNIYHKMIDYLSTNDMSEARLVGRIVRLKQLFPESARYKNYTRANCWKVIPILREQGYINEERYAQNLFDHLKDKKDGMRAIQRKMFARKIKKETVDAIIHSFAAEEKKQDLTKIVELAREKYVRLQEKYGNDKVKKYQIKQKLFAWLAMRGYSAGEAYEISSKAMRHKNED